MIDILKAKELIDTNNVNNKNNRILSTEGPVPFVQIQGFLELPGVVHGFSTRLGGVSEGIYESLNLGLRLDDDREKVLKNYELFGQSVGFDPKRISCPDQVHKDNILVVTEEDAGDGVARELSHFEIDAQITNCKNIPLIVYWADCVPILLYDPVSRVIGSVHAGWRGSVAGIAFKAVKKMVDEFGCLPENIHAVIGPSIGPDNYEVSEEVMQAVYACPYLDLSDDNINITEVKPNDQAVSAFSGSYIRDDMPENYLGIRQPGRGALYPLYRTVNFRKRYMLNLWNLNELILINAGISMGNIYNTRLCTMQYHDIFFSHRYTNGRRGLNAGIIMLK